MASGFTPPSGKKPSKSSNGEKHGAMRELAPLLGMGTELAGTVGLFGIVGWFIDKYAATKPFWFIALLLTGIIVGMVKMLRTIIKSGALKSKSKTTPSAPTTETKQ